MGIPRACLQLLCLLQVHVKKVLPKDLKMFNQLNAGVYYPPGQHRAQLRHLSGVKPTPKKGGEVITRPREESLHNPYLFSRVLVHPSTVASGRKKPRALNE